MARILHLLGVVVWIGGVMMVTTVILPAIKQMKTTEERLTSFEQLEGRFAIQARIAVLLTGASGFYMLHELNAWERYADYRFWWIHAMTLVWIVFLLLLFVLEPFVLRSMLKKQIKKNPQKIFQLIHRVHWILLILSFITIIGAIAGSHGWFFFY
jgi:uncharacterized membrane protein